VSDNEATTASKPKGVGRRRLLGGVGAGGLAAAVAVFGRSAPAFAGNYRCCNLVYNPPNMSISECKYTSGSYTSYYNWYCSSGYLQCQCCEHKVYTGGSWRTTGSAGSCT
jgi:hypothetical protein